MNVTEARADLSNAIDRFRGVEASYVAARTAREAADASLHAALKQGGGDDFFGIAEARTKASLAASEALESLARANSATILCANIVVESAAGQTMRIAVDDVGNTDVDITAWRGARNALLRDAAAPVPNGA